MIGLKACLDETTERYLSKFESNYDRIESLEHCKDIVQASVFESNYDRIERNTSFAIMINIPKFESNYDRIERMAKRQQRI